MSYLKACSKCGKPNMAIHPDRRIIDSPAIMKRLGPQYKIIPHKCAIGQAIRDLKKQLRETEKDRDHYKAICESLKDAPKPEYG